MSDPFVGQIMPIAFTYAPADWAYCYGQKLAVGQYQALFSLISNIFGGDGSSTFCVPNLAGRMVVGTGTSASSGKVYQHATFSGGETTTLTVNQLAPHTHDAIFQPVVNGSGPLKVSGTLSMPISGGTVTGITASGTATNLAVTASAANLPVTVSSASMSVSTANGGTNTQIPSAANNVLAAVAGLAARIYAPAGSSTTIPLSNPVNITATVSGAVTGTASGAVSVNVSGGTVSGSVGGTINLPVTGAQIVGGSVGIDQAGGGQTFSNMPPWMALNTVIALAGIYPPRP